MLARKNTLQPKRSVAEAGRISFMRKYDMYYNIDKR